MKTPEQLADEYTQAWWGLREDNMTLATRQAFLAGHNAAHATTDVNLRCTYKNIALALLMGDPQSYSAYPDNWLKITKQLTDKLMAGVEALSDD